MRKLVIVLALALVLPGCAQLQKLTDTATALTTSIANPVTAQRLDAFENGLIVAFAALNAYRKSCIAGAIPASCRGIIQQIQTYTRQFPVALAQIRAFVKNNDTVNAQLAYNQLLALYNQFKVTAATNGIQVP